MTLTNFQQVLTTARRLPRRSQVKLASTLLSETQVAPPLETLGGLSEAELTALLEESDQVALVKAKARYTLHTHSA
jgi:hypothetical protein